MSFYSIEPYIDLEELIHWDNNPVNSVQSPRTNREQKVQIQSNTTPHLPLLPLWFCLPFFCSLTLRCVFPSCSLQHTSFCLHQLCSLSYPPLIWFDLLSLQEKSLRKITPPTLPLFQLSARLVSWTGSHRSALSGKAHVTEVPRASG